MESHRRSLVKAITWRVAAIVITTTVAWVVTGELRFAATIGLADSALKIGAFYLHERAWNRFRPVRWGRQPAEKAAEQRREELQNLTSSG